jgi:hypothetical protein
MGESQPYIQEPRLQEEAEQKPQEQARLGPIQRLIGVLFSPGETFADVNRKPNWLTPMIIGIIFSIGLALFYDFVIQPDWTELTRLQFQRAPGGRTPPPEQFAMIAKFTRISVLVGSVVGAPIFYLIIAALFALGMLLMQAQTTFKKILSVIGWSFGAPGLVHLLLLMAVAWVKGFATLKTVPFQELFNITATNLAVVLGSNASPGLRAFAQAIDLFAIWILVLMIIGLTAVSGSKKISKGKIAALVLLLWGLGIAARVLLAVVTAP